VTRWVCLDVGETIIDETRVWETWADILGVTRFTFIAAIGAMLARGRPFQEVFEFLGFEFYWGKDRKNRRHLKRRTARKRLWTSLVCFAQWCRQVRNLDLRDLFRALNAKLRGYYNYYGVLGNYESLERFYRHALRILFKWLNRRSQLRSYNWHGFVELLEHYRVEKPRIVPSSRPRAASGLRA